VRLQVDRSHYSDKHACILETARLALEAFLADDFDFVLFLEDDLEFNHFIRHNVLHWSPVLDRSVTLASLYNPGVQSVFRNANRHFFEAHPHCVYGSQAFLISRLTVEYLLRRWEGIAAPLDIRLSRLAAQLQRPLYYHVPSLVQHVGRNSGWGGRFHQAVDFDPEWRTPVESRAGLAACAGADLG
jgi:hypothetical protein